MLGTTYLIHVYYILYQSPSRIHCTQTTVINLVQEEAAIKTPDTIFIWVDVFLHLYKKKFQH